MRAFIVVAALLLTSLAFAQPDIPEAPEQATPELALLVTPGGFYLINVDANGQPTFTRVQKVITVGSGGGGTDPPVVTPPPVEITTRSQVANWAKGANHPVGVQSLLVIWQTITQQVDDGKISTADAWPAINTMSNQILALPQINGTTQLAGFRAKLTDLINKKSQTGELGSDRQFVTFGKEVQAGLQDAIQQSQAPAMSPELLKLIMDIIQLVLSLITNLGNQTGI